MSSRTINLWEGDRTGDEVNANHVMSQVIDALTSDGTISAEVADRWKETHYVLMLRKSRVEAWLKHLFQTSDADAIVRIVVATVPGPVVEKEES